MRIRRVLRWWPAFVVGAMAILAYAAWPGRWTYTVSPETTYITEPLDADGHVDYATALNERLAKGVTPENNANVLIWQALGPHPEKGTVSPEYFRWLGVEPPPEQGDYFVSWDQFLEAKFPQLPKEGVGLGHTVPEWKQVWLDRLSRACRSPWSAKDEPEIAEWLKSIERPIALAIEASKCSRYFNPLVSKTQAARIMNSLLPTVQKCRGLGNALSCRAMVRVASGEFDAAWQDLLACQRFGRLMANGGTLIEDLIGLAIVAVATDAQISFLSHGRHSSRQIIAWSQELQELPSLPLLADKLDSTERFMTLDALLTAGRYGPDTLDGPGAVRPRTKPFYERLFTPGIDYDPAFRNANRVFDRCVAAGRLPDRSSRIAEYRNIFADVDRGKTEVAEVRGAARAFIGTARRGELIGKILIPIMIPAALKINDTTDQVEQLQRNLQVALALAAHRADNGRYPARLDELAPKYLPIVPGDLFSGKPLIYRPTEKGYLFYSVGINGIDEDGRWMDDEPKGDDLRVRMPVEEPKAK